MPFIINYILAFSADHKQTNERTLLYILWIAKIALALLTFNLYMEKMLIKKVWRKKWVYVLTNWRQCCKFFRCYCYWWLGGVPSDVALAVNHSGRILNCLEISIAMAKKCNISRKWPETLCSFGRNRLYDILCGRK